MNLYHFTGLHNVEVIKRDGLESSGPSVSSTGRGQKVKRNPVRRGCIEAGLSWRRYPRQLRRRVKGA
jgi:hypothetical protein